MNGTASTTIKGPWLAKRGCRGFTWLTASASQQRSVPAVRLGAMDTTETIGELDEDA
jgi:hypothetical protein